MAKKPNPGGKGTPKTVYTPEQQAEIMQQVCERMAAGDTVIAACKELGVEARRVREWALDERFADTYRLARETQAHALAEETLAIADDLTILPDSRRIMVDTRKWYTSKIAPKIYGERTKHEVTGADDGPVKVEQTLVFGDKVITF